MKKLSSLLGLLGILLMGGAGVYYLGTKELVLTVQVIGFLGLILTFYSVYENTDEIIDAFGGRSARYSGFALILVALMAVVLGLINYLAWKHPKKYDATENQSYTLTEQSKQIARGLKDTIQITAFFLNESPAKPKFKELVENYRAESTQINVTWIDPERDPLAVKQLGITTADTVVVARGTNEKRLNNVTEESLTNALIAVTRETQKTLCFLEGHNEKSLNETGETGLSEAKTALEKQSFAVKTVSLFKENKVPEECRVVASIGAEKPLMPNEKPILEQWVLAGGRLIVAVDPGVDARVAEDLKTWGVTARDDLAVDPVAQAFLGNAAVPMVVPAGQHKITEHLGQSPAFFPIARSLELASPAPHAGFFETLVKTTGDDDEARAWGETDLSLMKPEPGAEPRTPSFDEKDNRGPLTLGALLTIPVKAGASTPEASPEAAGTPKPEGAAPDKKEQQAMVAVFGDADFMSNSNFFSSVNGDLFLNTLSYMAEESDLLAIRPREKGKQTLTMSGAQADLIFYVTLFFMPSIPMLLGFFTFFRKRNM